MFFTHKGIELLCKKRLLLIFNCTVNATLGEKNNITPKYSNKYITNEFIYTAGGVYDRVSGFDELVNAGVLQSYFVFKTKGTEFSSEINSSGDRMPGLLLLLIHMTNTYKNMEKR